VKLHTTQTKLHTSLTKYTPFVNQKNMSITHLLTTSIRPLYAGITVGMLQLPLIMLVGRQLGTSSIYCCVIANINTPFTSYINKYSKNTIIHLYEYWRVCLVLGITIGSALSTYYTGSTYYSDYLISRQRAFIGGLLIALGSRLADGCTSGLGISQFGHLTVSGLIGTCCMFGAAIVTKMFV